MAVRPLDDERVILPGDELGYFGGMRRQIFRSDASEPAHLGQFILYALGKE